MPRTPKWSVIKAATRHLDRRLKDAAELRSKLTPPPKGWIRAIRESLGMTAAQLGKRMGVTQATVTELEMSEVKGTVRLDTLRRAAEAMNCTVVYAFIPNKPFGTIISDRIAHVAAELAKPTEQTMRLEDQGLSDKDRDEVVADYARSLSPRAMWD
jgi:predicted DNA-binding mobile mystery protein A